VIGPAVFGGRDVEVDVLRGVDEDGLGSGGEGCVFGGGERLRGWASEVGVYVLKVFYVVEEPFRCSDIVEIQAAVVLFLAF